MSHSALSTARMFWYFIWATAALPTATHAWITTTATRPRSFPAATGYVRPRSTSLLDSPVSTSSSRSSNNNNNNSNNISTSEETAATVITSDKDDDDDVDDDDEYEYIEYEALTETEFVNSEWLVGSNWDTSPSKIEETWARCVVDKNGKNVVVWGDKSSGKWSLDVATQFFSMSKENFLTGKKIWACTVEDYYFVQGTIRGWNLLQPASVLGQWQARRLGVDKDEAGTAPWFQATEDDDDDDSDKSPSLAGTADLKDNDEGIFKSAAVSTDSNVKSS